MDEIEKEDSKTFINKWKLNPINSSGTLDVIVV